MRRTVSSQGPSISELAKPRLTTSAPRNAHRPLASGDLTESRKAVRQLLLDGQTHIHSTKERDSRREQIPTEFAWLPVDAVLYEAPSGMFEPDQPQFCLEARVADAVAIDAQRLVIERDESHQARDQKTLYDSTHAHRPVHHMEYRLVEKREEPLLWVADGIAWA